MDMAINKSPINPCCCRPQSYGVAQIWFCAFACSWFHAAAQNAAACFHSAPDPLQLLLAHGSGLEEAFAVWIWSGDQSEFDTTGVHLPLKLKISAIFFASSYYLFTVVGDLSEQGISWALRYLTMPSAYHPVCTTSSFRSEWERQRTDWFLYLSHETIKNVNIILCKNLKGWTSEKEGERLSLLPEKCQAVNSLLVFNKYNERSGIWLMPNNRRTKGLGLYLLLLNQ